MKGSGVNMTELLCGSHNCECHHRFRASGVTSLTCSAGPWQHSSSHSPLMLKPQSKGVTRETQLAATEYGKQLDNTSQPEGMRNLQHLVREALLLPGQSPQTHTTTPTINLWHSLTAKSNQQTQHTRLLLQYKHKIYTSTQNPAANLC